MSKQLNKYSQYYQDVKKEYFEAVFKGRMMLFEIKVYDLENDEDDYLICNIILDDDKQTIYEDQFNTTIEIDEEQSFDYYLQGLYDSIIESICNSDKYTLADDE